MKTPREILLKHHEGIQGRLDAVREQVVAREANSLPVSEPAGLYCFFLHLPLLIWRELFWSCRRVWAGLAAVWLVMIAINIISLDETSIWRKTGRVSAPDIWAVLAERNRLLAEMGREESPSSPPSRSPAAPRPRSEYRIANRAHC